MQLQSRRREHTERARSHRKRSGCGTRRRAPRARGPLPLTRGGGAGGKRGASPRGSRRSRAVAPLAPCRRPAGRPPAARRRSGDGLSAFLRSPGGAPALGRGADRPRGRGDRPERPAGPAGLSPGSELRFCAGAGRCQASLRHLRGWRRLPGAEIFRQWPGYGRTCNIACAAAAPMEQRQGCSCAPDHDGCQYAVHTSSSYDNVA